MKEQDAANSFEKEILEKHIAHRQLLTFENYSCVGIPYMDALKAIQSVTVELTRLRSELQTLKSALDHCKEVGIIRQDLIAEQKSELQQKDEIIKELIVVAARISIQLKKGDSYRVHIESLIKKANVF